MVSTVVIACLLALLPVTSSLTKECRDATHSCIGHLLNFFAAKCVPEQNYYGCMDGVLSAAEKNGCDELSLIAYRQAVFNIVNTANTDSYKPCSIVLPSVYRLDECSQQIVNCGEYATAALLSSTFADRCQPLEQFKTCMETNTSKCSDRTRINRLIQAEFTTLQYQAACIDTTDISRAPTTTTTAHRTTTTPRLTTTSTALLPVTSSLTKQCRDATHSCIGHLLNFFAPKCVPEQNYYGCMDGVLSAAEKNGCDELSLISYRQAVFNIVNTANTDSDKPCSIVLSSVYRLDECSQQIANCGEYASAASLSSTFAERCQPLEQFKTCMETNTAKCSDRTRINRLIQSEFTTQQYQAACIDTTLISRASTTTTTAQRTTTTPTATITSTGKAEPNGHVLDVSKATRTSRRKCRPACRTLPGASTNRPQRRRARWTSVWRKCPRNSLRC